MRVKDIILIASLALLAACSSKPQKFETPEAAVQALIEAATAGDTKKLVRLFGKEAKPLVDSGDPVADKNSRDAFVQDYNAANSLDKSQPDMVTLEVGPDKWPFPIPLVQEDGSWFWDGATGTEELVNRRVGANELFTIQATLAYVDAQREFYTRNEEKSPFLHYANKLISSEGKRDGLYWPSGGDEVPSPLGEGFAKARAEGYLQDGGGLKGEPFHGYIYRLLKRQGANAPGGAYDYEVDGELLGGFALIAFPVEYGSSGVMTFLVNHDGVVYSKDLGADTAKLALAIEAFDPGTDWKKEDSTDLAAN
jgi:Protein of unknown function (DUF2950)